MIKPHNLYITTMRKIKLVIIATILFCSTVHSQTSIDSSRIVKVLTFNILHGSTTLGDFDLDVIAAVIINADPDLVALQEVDFKTNRARKYDLVTELAYRTSLAPLFGKAMPYDGGEYGEGILSKHSFITSRNVSLPCSPGNEPRAALQVVCMLPSGDTISFIGTHLDHTNDEHDRIMQANRINEAFSDIKYPAIIAGDLNAVPGSETISIFEEMWTPTYDAEGPDNTHPSNDPKKKIDYIMYYPQDSWRVISTQVICDTIASDHCAYLVSLELLNR